MINLKPKIVELLKQVTSEVYKEYPKKFTNAPCITYAEENNSLYAIASSYGEVLSEITFRIEIWNRGSTSSLAQSVDEKLSTFGLARIFCMDRDEEDYNHTIMRYQGIVDTKTNKIYTNNR